MTVVSDTDLLTIAEAAKLLKVSTVTLKRWLKQGRLPAYRLGPRAVRIHRSVLAKLLVPTSRERAGSLQEAMPIETKIAIRPLTHDEARQMLEALEASKALLEQMRARRGGEPLPSSWRLIRQARAARSRRL